MGSPTRIESKLREYNFYGLKLLTCTRLCPATTCSSNMPTRSSRRRAACCARSIGNTPYVEGWARIRHPDRCSTRAFSTIRPSCALTFQKEELRVIANAILDIRLQMLGMTDQQALDLMQKDTFQEAEEATAKLQRAKFLPRSCRPISSGWRGWLAVRDKYRQAKGRIRFPAAGFPRCGSQAGRRSAAGSPGSSYHRTGSPACPRRAKLEPCGADDRFVSSAAPLKAAGSKVNSIGARLAKTS